MKIVREHLIEGVADKFAEKEFYMPSEEAEFDVQYNKKEVESKERDKIIGQYTLKSYGTTSVIKNPSSLKNLGKNVRGVIDVDGNLYMETVNVGTHNTLINYLADKGLMERVDMWHLKRPTKFLTVQRVWDTPIIAIGESNMLLHDREDMFYPKRLAENISLEEVLAIMGEFFRRCSSKNPTLEFRNESIEWVKQELRKKESQDIEDEYPSVIEGVGDKFASKKLYIPEPHEDFEREYRAKEVGEKYPNKVVAEISGGIYIVRNPTTLDHFEADVRAIADEYGNLFVATGDYKFNHGDIGNALIKAGQIKCHPYDEFFNGKPPHDNEGIYAAQHRFLLLMRNGSDDAFSTSDSFEYNKGNTEKMFETLKKRNPQYEYIDDYDIPNEDSEYNKYDQ